VTADNLTFHGGGVDRAARRALLGHGAVCLWMTGLSGSGKSTLARAIEARLGRSGALAYVLDGDNVRFGLNADLGFAPEHRSENVRRVAEVAKLFVDAGIITMVSFISPYRDDRARARATLGADFVELYVAASLETCELRDPKGLYARARRGEIKDFTGLDAPYQAPESPELRIDTSKAPLDDCVEETVAALRARGVLP
jgi:adenylylsulfate kinase